MHSFSILLTSVFFVLCTAGQPDEKPTLTDKQLRVRIRKIVHDRIKPNDAEMAVGARAQLNTTEPSTHAEIRHLCLNEAFRKTVPRLDLMQHLILWTRPIQKCTISVAGVGWTKDDKLYYFEGEIPDPK
jgi:hypothetical protein